MWDDDFQNKKFELGRVIKRDLDTIQKDMDKLKLDDQTNRELANKREN